MAQGKDRRKEKTLTDDAERMLRLMPYIDACVNRHMRVCRSIFDLSIDDERLETIKRLCIDAFVDGIHATADLIKQEEVANE